MLYVVIAAILRCSFDCMYFALVFLSLCLWIFLVHRMLSVAAVPKCCAFWLAETVANWGRSLNAHVKGCLRFVSPCFRIKFGFIAAFFGVKHLQIISLEIMKTILLFQQEKSKFFVLCSIQFDPVKIFPWRLAPLWIEKQFSFSIYDCNWCTASFKCWFKALSFDWFHFWFYSEREHHFAASYKLWFYTIQRKILQKSHFCQKPDVSKAQCSKAVKFSNVIMLSNWFATSKTRSKASKMNSIISFEKCRLKSRKPFILTVLKPHLTAQILKATIELWKTSVSSMLSVQIRQLSTFGYCTFYIRIRKSCVKNQL